MEKDEFWEKDSPRTKMKEQIMVGIPRITMLLNNSLSADNNIYREAKGFGSLFWSAGKRILC